MCVRFILLNVFRVQISTSFSFEVVKPSSSKRGHKRQNAEEVVKDAGSNQEATVENVDMVENEIVGKNGKKRLRS